MNRLNDASKKIFLLGLVALLVPASLLFAGVRGGAFSGHSGFSGLSGFHGRGAMLHRIADKLDLSESQRTDIREVFQAHRAEIKAEVEKLRTARQEQTAAIHADAFDEDAIRAASAKVAAAQADLAVARAKIASEVREILTPEQRVKAKAMMAKARAFAEERFQRFRGRTGEGPFGGDEE